MNRETDPNGTDLELQELEQAARREAWLAWAQEHRQQLAAAAIALVLAMAGAGLWMERQRTEREAAAILYQQALNAKDERARTLLGELVAKHPDTAYAAMAGLLLAAREPAKAEAHLRRVLDHPRSEPEWRWQARLDLARLALAHGRKDEAARLLAEPVGEDYMELYAFLRAQLASGRERRAWLEKAKAAPSHDRALRRRIEAMLRDAS